MGSLIGCDTPCLYVERTSFTPEKEYNSLNSTISVLNTKVEALKLESYYKTQLINNLTDVNEALKIDNAN